MNVAVHTLVAVTLAVTRGSLILGGACWFAGPSGARAAGTYDLSAAAGGGQTMRVSVALELGGELIAREESSSATLAGDDAPRDRRSPLSVQGAAEYDERPLNAERSVRLYTRAEATLKTASGVRLPRLPSTRRLVVAQRRAGERLELAGAEGVLEREQLELVEMLGDAAVLDSLLPGRRVAEGEEWEIAEDVAGRLLGLDAVSACGLAGMVDDGNKRYARFTIAGSVSGAVDAAATELNVRGIGLYRRDQRRVVQLNLAVTEKRQRGPARPGLEGTAKVKIKRTPVATPPGLADDAIRGLADMPVPQQELLLRAGPQGFEVRHDREWFVAAEAPRSLTLRRVGPAGLLAQTTLERQSMVRQGTLPTIDRLRADVEFSLGESLSGVVATEDWTNQAGCRCVGLTARGEVDGVPVEWRYYLVAAGEVAGDASPRGPAVQHLVSIVTTVEQAVAGRVGDADRRLADRIRLAPPVASTKQVARLPPPPVRRQTARRSSGKGGTTRGATRPLRSNRSRRR